MRHRLELDKHRRVPIGQLIVNTIVLVDVDAGTTLSDFIDFRSH
jgi:hypothetical protein